jgi:uncharacterized protein with PQ loop repeat
MTVLSRENLYLSAGFCGSLLLSIRLIPQLYHTYKRRCVDGLSYGFMFIDLILTIAMIVYSFGMYFDININNFLPIVIGNTIALFSMIALIIMKWSFTKKNLVYVTIP